MKSIRRPSGNTNRNQWHKCITEPEIPPIPNLVAIRSEKGLGILKKSFEYYPEFEALFVSMGASTGILNKGSIVIRLIPVETPKIESKLCAFGITDDFHGILEMQILTDFESFSPWTLHPHELIHPQVWLPQRKHFPRIKYERLHLWDDHAEDHSRKLMGSSISECNPSSSSALILGVRLSSSSNSRSLKSATIRIPDKGSSSKTEIPSSSKSDSLDNGEGDLPFFGSIARISQ